MQGTNIYFGERDLKDYGNQNSCDGINYFTARPLGFISFIYRVKCAMRVISGEADIVVWGEHDTSGTRECWCKPEVVEVEKI